MGAQYLALKSPQELNDLIQPSRELGRGENVSASARQLETQVFPPPAYWLHDPSRSSNLFNPYILISKVPMTSANDLYLSIHSESQEVLAVLRTSEVPA